MKLCSNVCWKCRKSSMLNLFGLLIVSRKEEDMMAMIWAQQIMLGKKTYADVPRLLKEKVREILIDSGCEELVTE